MITTRNSLLLATVAAVATPLAGAGQAAPHAATPQTTAEWQWDEGWFLPLRYESADALYNAGYRFRRHEEQSAANELRKAESWLTFAATHALPQTKVSLQEAGAELHTLGTDLQKGKVLDAERLDAALARASRALGEWHFFLAKDQYGKQDERYAAQHLQAAARHLRQAATSARFEFGPRTVEAFDMVDEFGDVYWDEVVAVPNRLTQELSAIEGELERMKQALGKGSR